MLDSLDNLTLLSLLTAAFLIVALPLMIWSVREAHWRRLRRRGDPRAKRREIERNRRRRAA